MAGKRRQRTERRRALIGVWCCTSLGEKSLSYSWCSFIVPRGVVYFAKAKGSIKQPHLLCQQVFQPTVHYPLNLLSFCHYSLPSTTPHFTLRPVLCAPLTHCLQVSHTSLLLCTFDMNMQALWQVLCTQAPNIHAFTRIRRHGYIEHNIMFVRWSFPVRSTAYICKSNTGCREWAHTNDVHSYMYFWQLCKALFSLAHWKRLSSLFTHAKTRLRQQSSRQDWIAPSSHKDWLCRPIVKEYLLLCQNVICCSVKSWILQHKKHELHSHAFALIH